MKIYMDSIYLSLNYSQPLLQSTDWGLEYNLIAYKYQSIFKGTVCGDCFVHFVLFFLSGETS